MGLDPSKSMLEAAEVNKQVYSVKSLELVLGTGQQIPFQNQSFDLITCLLSTDGTLPRYIEFQA